MKPVRYIALVRLATVERGVLPDLERRIQTLDGFRIVQEDERLQVATDQYPHIDLGTRGLILGSLFERGGTPVRKPDRATCDRVAAGRGQALIDDYWGPYIAFLPNAGRRGLDIVRAPLGALPCYMVEIEGGLALASDVGLLIACGLFRPAVAWTEVLRLLLVRDLLWPETCLLGLRELNGGQRLSISDDEMRIEEVWSPWTFATRERQIEDAYQAACTIREISEACVSASTADEAGILLMLSGGLDSSILAAALARQARPVHCITFVSEDATGDERRYARQLCDALGLPLEEGWRDLSRIDVSRSDGRRLPRPTQRMFFQESRRLVEEAALRLGATAIVNGGGGDNIFCSLRSGAPAADRLLVEGPGRGFRRTVEDLSRLTQASMWAVAGDAVRRAWLGKPAFRALRDPMLLSPNAVAGGSSSQTHPWLLPPAGTLPGKAQHVRLMAFAQDICEGGDAGDALAMTAPLLAQPLVEACLTVPSWFWLEGGHDRAVARHAFEDQIPTDVAWRRSKGTPDAFAARIFEANRRQLREILSDGELVRQGLVDLQAIHRVIDDPRPVHGHEFRRILQFADIEAWAAGWRTSGV